MDLGGRGGRVSTKRAFVNPPLKSLHRGIELSCLSVVGAVVSIQFTLGPSYRDTIYNF